MSSTYNIITREVAHPKQSSLYSKFHEVAHKQQHDAYPVLFMVGMALRGVPVLGYFSTIAMEYAAMRRARRNLRILRLWNRAMAEEASFELRTYIWKQGL